MSLDIEELSEEELTRIKARFERLARKARDETAVSQAGSAILQECPGPAIIAQAKSD